MDIENLLINDAMISCELCPVTKMLVYVCSTQCIYDKIVVMRVSRLHRHRPTL